MVEVAPADHVNYYRICFFEYLPLEYLPFKFHLVLRKCFIILFEIKTIFFFLVLFCQAGEDQFRQVIPVSCDVIGSPLNFQMAKEQPPFVRYTWKLILIAISSQIPCNHGISHIL